MDKINVEVVFASRDRQISTKLQVKAGECIEAVIHQSGILTLFPEIDLTLHAVGIYGRKHQLTDPVNEGDRIEIYRPLLIDPKEARRAKSKKKSVNQRRS